MNKEINTNNIHAILDYNGKYDYKIWKQKNGISLGNYSETNGLKNKTTINFNNPNWLKIIEAHYDIKLEFPAFNNLWKYCEFNNDIYSEIDIKVAIGTDVYILFDDSIQVENYDDSFIIPQNIPFNKQIELFDIYLSLILCRMDAMK